MLKLVTDVEFLGRADDKIIVVTRKDVKHIFLTSVDIGILETEFNPNFG